ncbi:MAG: acetyl-CoA carboxylase, carboxyltransferase subunit beta [Clostridiales bacterium]
MNPFKQHKEHMNLLKMLKNKINPKRYANIPENLFLQCEKCGVSISCRELTKNLLVCEKCGFHHKVPSYLRMEMILDPGSFQEKNKNLVGCDPLNFPNYADKVENLQETTGLKEAVVTATGSIEGNTVAMAVLDSSFLMGSMGVAVGEKITRIIEYATKNQLPLIIISSSGGARMQEGILSLMQMAKTAAAIEQHNKAGLLYISVLTNPTTGGVTASFASLGDIIIAEPEALIGFAGPRVIEETIGEKLPKGFQTAEYLLEHGFLDSITERKNLRETLGKLIALHSKRGNIL